MKITELDQLRSFSSITITNISSNLSVSLQLYTKSVNCHYNYNMEMCN